jgi:predicted butyrate kinase (DUF1464 family)
VPRVVGIDLGTISLDLCGLHDGRVFVEQTIPTAAALAQPASLIDLLASLGPLDLIAGPSGYGLPLVAARDLSDSDIQLASLAAEGEPGIGGFRALLRAFQASTLPIVLTPGVIHLASVPAHRKVNRVDMGTADKVAAVALALHQESRRRQCLEDDVSFLFLELGGAFSAAVAVQNGRIVDGFGGTSGPMGLGSAGALDGEVAFLAGHVSKPMLFAGGANSIARASHLDGGLTNAPASSATTLAWDALSESTAKSVAALSVTVPGVRDLVVSGRLASEPLLQHELTRRLATPMGKVTMHPLTGFTSGAKQGAQGAALLADGLAGGASESLVTTLGIREASGSVLDHLYVISAEAARRRLGLIP